MITSTLFQAIPDPHKVHLQFVHMWLGHAIVLKQGREDQAYQQLGKLTMHEAYLVCCITPTKRHFVTHHLEEVFVILMQTHRLYCCKNIVKRQKGKAIMNTFVRHLNQPRK